MRAEGLNNRRHCRFASSCFPLRIAATEGLAAATGGIARGRYPKASARDDGPCRCKEDGGGGCCRRGGGAAGGETAGGRPGGAAEGGSGLAADNTEQWRWEEKEGAGVAAAQAVAGAAPLGTCRAGRSQGPAAASARGPGEGSAGWDATGAARAGHAGAAAPSRARPAGAKAGATAWRAATRS